MFWPLTTQSSEAISRVEYYFSIVIVQFELMNFIEYVM